jgi:hypothetical protein
MRQHARSAVVVRDRERRDERIAEQVERMARAERVAAPGFFATSAVGGVGKRRKLSVQRRSDTLPGPAVVMVAVDTEHPDDERHSPLRWTTGQIVSLDPSAGRVKPRTGGRSYEGVGQ